MNKKILFDHKEILNISKAKKEKLILFLTSELQKKGEVICERLIEEDDVIRLCKILDTNVKLTKLNGERYMLSCDYNIPTSSYVSEKVNELRLKSFEMAKPQITEKLSILKKEISQLLQCVINGTLSINDVHKCELCFDNQELYFVDLKSMCTKTIHNWFKNKGYEYRIVVSRLDDFIRIKVYISITGNGEEIDKKVNYLKFSDNNEYNEVESDNEDNSNNGNKIMKDNEKDLDESQENFKKIDNIDTLKKTQVISKGWFFS